MLTDRILRRQVNLVRVKILEEGAVHREREVADVDASLYAALLPVILEIIDKLKVQNVPEKSFFLSTVTYIPCLLVVQVFFKVLKSYNFYNF